MSAQLTTEQLADELENTPFESTRYEAAKELRRLEDEVLERKRYGDEQTDFAIKNANERDQVMARVLKIEAANAELLESLIDLVALYPLDSTDAIITSARAAIKKHGGAA